MPARNDIKSILIIGSGPIVIGQACEFDYSGNQAVQALKEEGYRVIVHNPNPASVMTIASLSDAVYMEPLDIEHLSAIIEKESPDAILPTMGGQSALNLALEFHQSGLHEKYNVEYIGASINSILLAEDRGLFKDKMTEIGLESPFSSLVKTEHEAFEIAKEIGFPLIIRPSFTLGGKGGGIVYNEAELKGKIRRALLISPTHTALVEESLLGYQEFEFEVVRDKADNALIVCSIENLDPMGIHTGDSITVAPIQTLSDIEYQLLRDASIQILRAVEVECGGSNVQLAYHPIKKRLLVIEMNPRVSRSSALASKATGFPIARCAAKLAVGFTLDEIINEITGKTTAFFEPSIDYIAVKVPRFDLKKFNIFELGTQMKSVGESLSLGRTFPEALNKAIRAVEIGLEGLEPLMHLDDVVLENMVSTLHPRRIFAVYTILYKYGEERISDLEEKTAYHIWFLYHLAQMAKLEKELKEETNTSKLFESGLLLRAKCMGFTDNRIAKLIGVDFQQILEIREKNKLFVNYHCVDTCAGEFKAQTPYYYGTYGEIDEDDPITQPAVAIIGSGPNRIGQGLEFDTCCTIAALSFKKQGYKVIMINSNPETVSTDYNISDRLYLEPLHAEDIYEVLRKENIGTVICQLGGQTPIRVMDELERRGISIMGSSSASINEAEDRDLFSKLLHELEIQQPKSATVNAVEDIINVANDIGYPILIRPSYVIGGQSMRVIYSEHELDNFISDNHEELSGVVLLIDKFLENAIEFDVDAVSDGESVYIAGVLEHIEHAGVHSGDSACVFINHNTVEYNNPSIITQIYQITYLLATRLGKKISGCGIKGFLNIQFAYSDGILYVLEANPRASRTIPFISKVSGVDVVALATHVWLGNKLNTTSVFIENKLSDHNNISVGTSIPSYSVKEAVFSFDRFESLDPVLSPEMRSTGESIGIGDSFGEAFTKASISAHTSLPTQGCVFISLAKEFRTTMLPLVQKLVSLNFDIVATRGTAKYFNSIGIQCRSIYRVNDGSPNVIDELNLGKIEFVINILKSVHEVSYHDDKEIRIATVRNRIPYVTTVPAAAAAIEGIEYLRKGNIQVKKLLMK